MQMSHNFSSYNYEGEFDYNPNTYYAFYPCYQEMVGMVPKQLANTLMDYDKFRFLRNDKNEIFIKYRGYMMPKDQFLEAYGNKLLNTGKSGSKRKCKKRKPYRPGDYSGY